MRNFVKTSWQRAVRVLKIYLNRDGKKSNDSFMRKGVSLASAGCSQFVGLPGSDLRNIFTYLENNAWEGCFQCLDQPFHTQNWGYKQQPVPEGYT